MPKYLAVYYFPGSKSRLFPTPEPSHVHLQSQETEKAWSEAVALVNEANKTMTGALVEKIEVYQLVAEETWEENKKRRKEKETNCKSK